MVYKVRRSEIFALAVICCITFFAFNSLIIPDIMESRNIITAREMVYDGHWIIPTMNGELRLEKPPLPTWITAVAELISPDNLALQRSMAGLAAMLLVFYFYRFADRVLRIRQAWVSTLLLCTCYNFILMSRTASWDIYCHAFMMAGIYHFAVGYRSAHSAVKHFALAGLWTALSIMSKGPVSPYALFLPFLLSLKSLGDGTMKGKGKSVALMIVIAIVVGCAWYVYVHISAPEMAEYVAKKESGSWHNHNVRPWYYYWQFFLEAGVWAMLLLTATLYPLIDRKVWKTVAFRFSWLWMIVSLILLSLMPEKKTRYLLPMLIPACLLMGALLEVWYNTMREKMSRVAFRANAILLTVVIALIPIGAWVLLYKAGAVSALVCVGYTVVAEVIAVWLLSAVKKPNPYRMVKAVTALFVFAECAVLPAADIYINNTEAHSIACTRNMPELDGLAFYHDANAELRIELVYAAHRQIRALNLNESDSVLSHLPCAVLTHGPIEEVISPELVEQLDIEYVGEFDDNHRPKGNRRYSDEFIYRLTILRSRK